MDCLIGDYLSWQLVDLNAVKSYRSGGSEVVKGATQLKKRRKMTFETHSRAWVKSLVWRLAGIAILGLVSWTITHNWKEMTTITVLFHGTRVILYYFHERLWEKISWGRVKHPLSVFPVIKDLEPEDFKIIQSQLKKLGYLD
jgi:uncharacterized membrane protein